MTDETTPVQQEPPEAETPASPEQQAPSDFDLSNYVEKSRFTGAIQKIQKQSEDMTALQAEITKKNSELEQLQVRLAEEGAGHQALVGQRDQSIQELHSSRSELENELKQAKLDLQKVAIAREIGRPDLIEILDTIPGVEDPEAMKNIMTNIASFAENQVQKRESELLSGMTPGVTSVANAETQYPDGQDSDAWQKLLGGLDPYSKEHDQALKAWGEQLRPK